MRNDIHRPSAPEFDPEAYDLQGVWDLFPQYPDPASKQNQMETISRLLDQGYKFGNGGSGGCGHCGQTIRYAALMTRADVKEMIYVGEQCLHNRFLTLTKGQFDFLRETARLNKERATIKEKRDKFIAENTEVQELLAFQDEMEESDGFFSSLVRQLMDNGELSDKQVAAIRPAIERARKWIEVNKQREAEADILKAAGVKAPDGRVEVKGKIVSIKGYDTPYGYEVKMLVQAEQGYKVWLTKPSSIWSAEEGNVIQFTATLTPTDDPLFAYGKRPSKAQIVKEAC